MLSDWLPVLAATAGTAAGGAATYIVAARKSSGRIRTSEAEVLWEASENIRRDLTAALATQRAEFDRLRTDMAQMTTELDRVKEDNRRLNIVLEVFRKRMEGD